MKHILPIIALLFTTHIFAIDLKAVVLEGSEAKAEVPEANMLRYKSFSSIPVFIRFDEAKQLNLNNWQQWMSTNFFDNNEQFGFELIGTEEDQLGMVHYRFNQTFNGVKVEFASWIVHAKENRVLSMNGELFDAISDFNPGLSESEALEMALGYVGAETYKWEIDLEEQAIQHINHDHNATYYPIGEKVIINTDPALKEVDLHLTWKFNIYAHEPMSRQEVYVDATSGNTIFTQDLIHHADSNGTAVTNYNGNFNLVADYTGSNFRLRESGRGNGISTYNLNSGTNGLGSDILDNDNVWNSTAANEMSGPDAHFGTEMTYDFFFANFGRNSIDDSGFELISRVNYGNNFTNAFWDGNVMTYGSGGASFATIDIAGHEVTHGLTTNTAALIYSYESGALNESFSDIFGAAIEFYAEGGISDWLLGEDRGSVIRYMNNPNLGGDPDTYLGDFWHTEAWDNGGVHINSGVQNFWFYLLTEGGSGTNDLNNNYSVDALGVEKAQAIAFRNLTVYLTPSSQYFDARFYAIQSAVDLYGNCSEEVEQTTNAWYAVGVGDEYVEGVDADFDPSETEICVLPYTVSFSNESTNADTYVWDFGDGNNSGLESPSHTYTQEGEYIVMLDASSDCGEDEKSRTISIELPIAPTSATAEVCPGDVATLFATPNVSGTNWWYDDSTSTTPIYEGDTFITPVINSTIPYFVSTKTNGNSNEVGEPDNNFGPGSPFNNLQYLVFDVYESAILDSVRVYATGSGEREIVLLDAFGNEITSMIVDLDNGEQMVELGMELPVGTDLQIGLGDGGDLNLYRNASGADYPYEINDVLSIKRSTAFTNGGLSHYYFLYDWHVSYGSCESAKTIVYASVSECLGMDEINSNDVTIFPNPSIGSFTITWDGMIVNTIDVRNMHGQLVSQIKPSTTQIEMNLNSGAYMVNIIGSEGAITKKVIVQ